MKKIIHRAETRGHADYGWLDTRHTFSFSNYYDPERINFGALRVLNDDIVAGGGGFGSHPHENMEIVSIPLQGSLEHKDSAGNSGVIRPHDVQIMSAGKGIVHSEYNHSKKESVNFLQIWVFPKEKNIQPRYDQKSFNPDSYKNEIREVVGPEENSNSLWINQNSWFSLTNIEAGNEVSYTLHQDTNGVYIFVIDGEIKINDETLSRRDGVGISETNTFSIEAMEKAHVLLIEVPMSI